MHLRIAEQAGCTPNGGNSRQKRGRKRAIRRAGSRVDRPPLSLRGAPSLEIARDAFDGAREKAAAPGFREPLLARRVFETHVFPEIALDQSSLGLGARGDSDADRVGELL